MKTKRFVAGVLAAAMCFGCLTACGGSDNKSSDNGSAASATDSAAEKKEVNMEIRDISSWDLVKEMKIGWNLGNTMDATGKGLEAETSWQPAVTTEAMAKLLAGHTYGRKLQRRPRVDGARA